MTDFETWFSKLKLRRFTKKGLISILASTVEALLRGQHRLRSIDFDQNQNFGLSTSAEIDDEE